MRRLKISCCFDRNFKKTAISESFENLCDFFSDFRGFLNIIFTFVPMVESDKCHFSPIDIESL